METYYQLLDGHLSNTLLADDFLLYLQNADDVLIDNRAALVEGYQQFEKVKQEAQNHVELANKVANTLLSRGEETVARQVVKLEPVYEIAPSVKQVGPGNKRSKKPKKKFERNMAQVITDECV